MTDEAIWERLRLKTIGGQEYETTVRKTKDASAANAFLDRWMRAKLCPQSIALEDWRTFTVWTGDSVVFLGDVESVHWVKADA